MGRIARFPALLMILAIEFYRRYISLLTAELPVHSDLLALCTRRRQALRADQGQLACNMARTALQPLPPGRL